MTVAAAAAVRECSPRTPLAARHPRAPIRALRGRSRLKERLFSRNSVDLRSYPTQQLEQERSGKTRVPPLRIWTARERRGDARLLPSGLPVILISLRLRLLSTHLRTHTHGLSCPWLQQPSPANHDIVQAAVLMLLADGPCGGGGITGREDGECAGPAPTLWI